MKHIARTQEPDECARITEYWSEERMAAATPTELPHITREQAERLGLPPRERQQEPSGPIEDGVPVAPDTTVAPYYNCGALFYKNSRGEDRWGSAAFVGAAGVLLTAAHCLRDGSTGAWHTDVYFMRAYQRTGSAPTGQRFNVERMLTSDQWVNPDTGGNLAYDYAFCTVYGASGWNGHLGFLTGGLIARMTAVGYPGNYGEGRRMYAVTSSVVRSGSYAYMPQNPFRHGASGGPWIGNVSAQPGQDRNQANGVTSYYVEDEPGVYSPYFDQATWELFQKARLSK